MTYYRLNYLNSAGHVVRALDFQSNDDQHAMLTVDAYRDGRAMELWQGSRVVTVFEAPLPARASFNQPQACD
jgi:hypothetical protein